MTVTTDKPDTELTVEALSDQIAETIFPHVSESRQRERLFYLLVALASEIKRKAIEP